MRLNVIVVVVVVTMLAWPCLAAAALVSSRQSGNWSDATTWDCGKRPAAGDSVHVRPGHRVVYDVASDEVIRTIHVAGAMTFATDRDTRLTVGLLRVQPGDAFAGEGGIDHPPAATSHPHHPASAPAASGPARAPLPLLEVGTARRPVDAGRTAVIRLAYVDGMDRDTCPAIVADGGRVDLHGAAMSRTWVKLGLSAEAGESKVFLAEPVTGWRAGDRIIVTATSRQMLYTDTYTKSVVDAPRTEERTITKIDRHHGMTRLALDAPLAFAHRGGDGAGGGAWRGEVANLSRNVVVESVDPDGVRGHTMFHAGSAASIGYAEFRRLGKRGLLGRYPLHFHQTGESMRGSSVTGASVWDSENHLLTIHGARYLVVRDCVGYRSRGHGFYLEDGTEAFNVLDRNLAVQATRGEPLPRQFLPFDRNDGAGFWWANSRNAFTRNVAVECDQYGFRFEAVKTDAFDPTLPVPQPDGSTRPTDLRTIPFVRFDGNEAHSHRRFGLNLGGIPSHRGYGDGEAGYEVQTEDVNGVAPDRFHPFVLSDSKLWDCQWPFHAGSPMVIVDGMHIFDSEYGLWRSVMLNHTYHDLTFDRVRSHTIFFPRTGGPNQFDPRQESPPEPKDDAAPFTVMTSVEYDARRGRAVVRGTAVDNGAVARVTVNGVAARATDEGFLQWEAELDVDEAGAALTSTATDAAGNVEVRPHVVSLPAQ